MRSGKAPQPGETWQYRGRTGSQWSLTFEVRKSYAATGFLCEPGLSQWSLTFEVRKRTHPAGNAIIHSTSQWSLTFEVRKSGSGPEGFRQAFRVAMEPDL